MKKAKLIGALLAGVMAATSIPAVPALAASYTVKTEASKLAAPTGLKATVSGTTVKLSWNAVKGADAYRIYKFNSDSGEYETLKNVSGTSTSIKNLAKGTYNFRVAALVKSGEKLKAQTKSSAVKATVKGTSTTAKSSAIISFPSFGTTGKKAASAFGLKQSQYLEQVAGTARVGCFVGTKTVGGKPGIVMLMTTEDDVYFAGLLMMNSSDMSMNTAYRKIKSVYGEAVKAKTSNGDLIYLWETGKKNCYCALTERDYNGTMVTAYTEYNLKYAPGGMEGSSGTEISEIFF